MMGLRHFVGYARRWGNSAFASPAPESNTVVMEQLINNIYNNIKELIL
jgi:hypothetical protein